MSIDTLNKEYFANKIASNQIEGVLGELKKILSNSSGKDGKHLNRLVLIESKFNEYQFQSTSGLIDKQTEFLVKNRTRYELINFIEDLPDHILLGTLPTQNYELYEEPTLTLRIRSILIDFVLIVIISFCLIRIFFFLSSEEFMHIKLPIFISLVITLIQVKDLLYGKSIGKRFTNLCVKDINGRGNSNEIFYYLRNITLIVFPIELIFVFLIPSRRLGDIMAGTIVVKNSNPLPFLQSIRVDLRKYSFTKDMLIAIPIGIFICCIQALVIWYLLIYEIKYQF